MRMQGVKKSESLVEARAAMTAQRPVSYGDIEYQLKKACVERTNLQIDRHTILNINGQIKMMRDQEEMSVLAYGQILIDQ